MLTMSITPPPPLEDSPLFAPVRRRGRKKGQVNTTPSRLYRDRAARAQRCTTFNAANPSHAKHWLSAMTAGAKARPRCEAIKGNGERCGRPRMKCAPYCCKHIPDDILAEHDRKERVRLQIFILDRRSTASVIQRALRTIVTIEQRGLKRLWASGMWSHPGVTLHLATDDEHRVNIALLRLGADINAGVLTPRTIDLLRWSAFNRLRNRHTESRFKRSVSLLLKEDAAWRAAHV